MAATKPQAHFAYIDALRGYAILGVVVVHTGGAIGLGPAIWWGARGVQLFFVVSALTLTHTWYSRSDGVAAFFVRRIFRIVPMFWLAIAYYLAGNGAVGAWQILASVTLLHGLHPESIMSIVPGGWSISDEALFYLAFPLLAAMLTTWARAAVALALALAAAVWWRRHGIALMQPAALTPQSLSDFVFCSMPGQLPGLRRRLPGVPYDQEIRGHCRLLGQ